MSDQKGGSGGAGKGPGAARSPKRPDASAEDAVVLPSGSAKTGAGGAKPAETSASSAKVEAKSDVSAKPDTAKAQPAKATGAASGDGAKQSGATADRVKTDGAEPPKAKAESAPPAAAAKAQTSPLAPGLIGGVIGGVAVAILAPLVSGFLPDSMNSPSTKSVASRFASQTEALTAAEAALKARLDEFELALAQNREAAQTAQTDVSGASERLEKLAEDVATLDGQMDAMNQATVQRESARTQTMGDLRSQVASLAAAIAATPTPTGEAGTVSAPVETRLALLEGAARRLEARINGLSTDALPTPDLSRIDLLETRVRALEARPIGAGGDASLGVAFAGLAQAISGSAPFETELLTLEKVAGIELPAALGDPAAAGLPSATSLATRFDPASVQALQAASMAAAKSKGGDWTEALTNRLAALVVVRRTDEIEGDSPEAIVSRARARLAEGDVRAALIELEPFPQAGRDAMAGWLEDAERRANAEIALAGLKEKLLGGE